MMLRTHRLAVVLAAVAVMTLTLASCRGASDRQDGHQGIPRPKAYPRIQLYDSVYTDRHGLDAGFEVNEATEVNRPGGDRKGSRSDWADVRYPAYNATLHCTFTPVDESTRDEVVDNRTRRMALNVGSNTAEQIGLSTPAGYEAIVLTTVGATVTPLQFVAAGNEWVVSGALTFDAESIDTDSVLPVIGAVRSDVIHAIKNLE